MRTSSLALALTVSLVAPAARGHAQTTPSAGQVVRASHHDHNRIGPDEIEQSHATTVWDLVQSLRPTWLNRHNVKIRGATANVGMGGGPESSEGLKRDMIVLVDGQEYGDMQTLRQLPVQSIYSIEFLASAQLFQRYGRNSYDGAVVIHTTPNDDPAASHDAPPAPNP
jgi:hypothetical protein